MDIGALSMAMSQSRVKEISWHRSNEEGYGYR